jgi:hypothetical protein
MELATVLGPALGPAVIVLTLSALVVGLIYILCNF